jgi:cyclic pyranopterin phosphate synthase
MVDVTAKAWTRRRAVARCRVVGDPDPAPAELLEEARIAGVQAAKQTAQLVPLCHPLPGVDVRVACWRRAGAIEVESRAEVTGPTGVEMEALTACAVAGLTIVAGLGAATPGVSMEDLTLWEKSGGRSGTWVRT